MKNAQQGKDHSKRKPLVAITAYAIAVLVALFIAEVVLRIAMPQLGAEGWSAGVFCHNRRCDYRTMVPHAVGQMKGREFGEVAVKANGKGYRDREWPTDDSATVVLGDSFGWGWGVSDTALWKQVVDSPAIAPIINLSMPGDDWFRMQHRFRLHQNELKAKNLVVLCYINDFFGMDDQLARRDSLNQTGFYSEVHSVLDGCETSDHKGRFYPFNRLYVYKMLKGFYVYFNQRNEGEGMSDYHSRLGYSADASFLSNGGTFYSVCANYRDALRETAGELPITVVYIPPVYAIDSTVANQVSRAAGVSLARYDDFYEALLESFAGTQNLEFVDLHPSLSRAHGASSVYFLNDGHLNAHGHRVMGECVAAAILPHPSKKKAIEKRHSD